MKLIGFDVETGGMEMNYALQPFRMQTFEAWLTSVAWSPDPEVRHLFPRELLDPRTKPSKQNIRKILGICAENNITVCAWNTPFDAAWLIAWGLKDEVFKVRWLDGMLLYRHLFGEPSFISSPTSFGLKAAVARFMPRYEGYDEGISFSDNSPDMIAKRRIYNVIDANLARRLTRFFLYYKDMTAACRRAALVEAACIPLVAESHVEGIHADRARAKKLAEELKNRRITALVALQLQEPEVTDKTIASPKQLSDLLYRQWKLPVLKITPTGAMSTDRESLKELAAYDTRASLLNDIRENGNNRTKFAKGTLDSLDYNGDGKVRPQFRIFGTYTGRGTYSSKVGRNKDQRPSGIPLHQWKRDPAFRGIIKPPPGFSLLEFDFAGQEFRWMAVVSGDETMLSLCAPGEDAHSFMAARINGLDYRQFVADLKAGTAEYKTMRTCGKVANLSLQYRTGAKRLRSMAAVGYGLKLSEIEAKAIHGTYRTTYPRVPSYWRRAVQQSKSSNRAINLVGRSVFMGKYDPSDNTAWQRESTFVNYPIQSMGADQKYLALLVLRNMLPKYGGKFYYELHDGIFVVIPEDKAQQAAADIKAALSNLPYKKAYDLTLPVQFPVDAKIGPSWGELVDFVP